MMLRVMNKANKKAISAFDFFQIRVRINSDLAIVGRNANSVVVETDDADVDDIVDTLDDAGYEYETESDGGISPLRLARYGPGRKKNSCTLPKHRA